MFHGELAGRMDLEQAGLSAGYLYEGLSYDRCGRMFRKLPREAIRLVMSLRMKLGLLAICSLIAFSGTCYAQNSANIPSAVVKVDSLAVYPDMNTSGRIVQSLKKGEEVVIDFEIKATRALVRRQATLADEQDGLRAMPGFGTNRAPLRFSDSRRRSTDKC